MVNQTAGSSKGAEGYGREVSKCGSEQDAANPVGSRDREVADGDAEGLVLLVARGLLDVAGHRQPGIRLTGTPQPSRSQRGQQTFGPRESRCALRFGGGSIVWAKTNPARRRLTHPLIVTGPRGRRGIAHAAS